MTATDWLTKATEQLRANGIDTATLDALVMLEDCSGLDRGYLLAHPELEIDSAITTKLNNLLTKRCDHVPLSYLRGKSEFYGREFKVGTGVLAPRPESETIIEMLKALMADLKKAKITPPDGENWRIADVGTGSGALGITASLEVSNVRVELIELEPDAIEIAKMNVIIFATATPVVKSDLLSDTSTEYDILLCNLPYVPDEFPINRAASYEPSVAIFGGPDGLSVYRALFSQIASKSFKPLYLLTEALPDSHLVLAGVAANNGYRLIETSDFIQLFELGQRTSF